MTVAETVEPGLFLQDAWVTRVDGEYAVDEAAGAPIAAVQHTIVSRTPWVERTEQQAYLHIPTFHGDELTSVVSLLGKSPEQAVGVFEVWKPDGVYGDLKLSSGFYGRLDRFENVSSFVRFEPGSGLPGQTRSQLRALLHDQLPNHAGFLRAAGASADDLQTAIGIPLVAADFVASVVVISSRTAPLAKRMEVWSPQSECQWARLQLVDLDNATGDGPVCQATAKRVICSADARLFQEVSNLRSAVLLDAATAFDGDYPGERATAFQRVLAIPTYVTTAANQIQLSSLALLLF